MRKQLFSLNLGEFQFFCTVVVPGVVVQSTDIRDWALLTLWDKLPPNYRQDIIIFCAGKFLVRLTARFSRT